MYNRISSYLLFNIFVQLPPTSTYKCYITIITDLKLIAGDAWHYAKFILSQTTLDYI